MEVGGEGFLLVLQVCLGLVTPLPQQSDIRCLALSMCTNSRIRSTAAACPLEDCQLPGMDGWLLCTRGSYVGVAALVGSQAATAAARRFNHIVGYGASYYSYLYAQCLSANIWQQHFAADPLSRSAGEALRHKLLAPGKGREAVSLDNGT